METLLYRDPRCLAHEAGPEHPESAARVATAWSDLDAAPVPGVTMREARPAEPAELGRVHSADHVARVAATAGRSHVQLDADTATCARSHEAALLAAGACVDAVEEVLGGRARGAFALVRPPGHHAERARAMGFCLFNNVAVAAAHATAAGGCRRVLILDPDVHHGNGTQSAFWQRDDVLFVSSHQWPFYPGTGAPTETGEGRGAGRTVNLPLPAGAGDADLLHAYESVVGPIVDAFRPELILVSAGFDTWHADPLGGFAVSAAGFRALFGLIARWAAIHCNGRIVAALEGGYDPEGVRCGVRATLEAIAGVAPAPEADLGRPSAATRERCDATRRALLAHWPALA